ncbi:MAG: prepilin-type N-terminal cleavage/methylation domain-containing protein [Tenericutes bacterium]|nr:prepilin-type N-terminal cleavage/methylation domain-containing protein [Mycoplasmatota bacterium]
MKNKGFTLIELLAVIVILSVITLITIPMITNVIEESKKKALMSSVQGILDSTNYFTISHEAGVYEFLFDKEHQGSTIKGESLDYRGNIEGEGKLYLGKEGSVSVCISNDTYYAYKNYNSGIVVGDKKTGNCIIGFDALTNKYVAMLDNGTGNVSNVYSKDEVDNLVDNLDTKITSNINEITSMKSNIEELQNNLNNYALQSELDKTNTNVENLSSLVNSNQKSIQELQNSSSSLNGTHGIVVVFSRLHSNVYALSNTVYMGDLRNKSVSITNAAIDGEVFLTDSELKIINQYLEVGKDGITVKLENLNDSNVVALAKKLATAALNMVVVISDK